MGILNKIKWDRGRKGSRAPNVLDMVKESAPATPKDEARPIKDDTGSAYRILQSAHLSEKVNTLALTGRYVFKVSPNANKLEIRKAVERVFDVHVVRVNVINIPGKRRRRGRRVGRTSDWKKAMVTVRAGEKIAGLTETV